VNLSFSASIKKGKQRIAPLQPSALAQFPAWGSETGAGRSRLPLQKYDFNLPFPSPDEPFC